MVSIEEITMAAHRIMVDRPVRVEVVRVGVALAYELERQSWINALKPHAFSPPGITDPHVGGLRIVVDDHLPADVWRLCDEDMTLLYDCREGTHAL
jgi:hypothetical protein